MDCGVKGGEIGNCLVGGRVGCHMSGQKVRRSEEVSTICGKEGRDRCGVGPSVVQSKGASRKERGPVGLVVVAEDPKIRLDRLVGSLGLAVALRVEGGGEVGANMKQIKEGGEERRGKGCATIRDDVRLESVMSDDVVQVHASQSRSVEASLGVWDDDDHLGEPIDKDLDAVEAIGRGKFDDAVHRDLTPGRSGRRYGLEKAVGELTRRLVAGAGVATGDVGVDEVAVARPGKGAAEEVVSAVTTLMTSKRVVMAGSDEVKAELVIVGDVDQVVEHDKIEGRVQSVIL